jgi:hypothetical protein
MILGQSSLGEMATIDLFCYSPGLGNDQVIILLNVFSV